MQPKQHFVQKKADDAWDVFQRQDNLLLKTVKTKVEADTLARKANRGAGFRGAAPQFFAQKEYA
jgi:hypothetical protein